MDKEKNINKLNSNKIPDSFAVSFFVREISNLNYSGLFRVIILHHFAIFYPQG
jgi:hypothetical protein